MIFGVIYVWQNLLNKKHYVGQTKSKQPDLYIRKHVNSARLGSRKYFHIALRKYGRENFKYQIIYIAFSKEELDRAEEFFIAEYNSVKPGGYNIRYGGSTAEHSLSSRRKMSAAWDRPGARESRSAATRAGMANPVSKAYRSELTRAQMANPEIAEKIASKIRVTMRTQEYREACSRRMREVHSRPEVKAKHKASCKAGHSSEEVRAKHRAAYIGTMWITDGIINIRLPSEKEEIPLGWRRGMTWRKNS